jgi:coronin-7
VSETSPAVEEICQEKEVVVENDDDPKSESETVKSETVEENESSAVSGHAPKTPSTAERRKMFESNTKENEPEDNFDVIDQSGTFERASVQRSSIAERRKMYENRSQSVQETPTVIIEKAGGSPVMLRRKDSFKNRKNAEDVLKDDNSRKSGQVSKQLSLDHQAGKKGDNFAAPTPKRTSTVFGNAETSSQYCDFNVSVCRSGFQIPPPERNAGSQVVPHREHTKPEPSDFRRMRRLPR